MSRTERLQGKQLYKILDLTGLIWQRNGFNITIITDETKICQVICNAVIEGTVLRIVPKLVKDEVNMIKVYKKDYSVYIYANWNPDTNYAAFIDSDFPIRYVGELDSSYEEIQVV